MTAPRCDLCGVDHEQAGAEARARADTIVGTGSGQAFMDRWRAVVHGLQALIDVRDAYHRRVIDAEANAALALATTHHWKEGTREMASVIRGYQLTGSRTVLDMPSGAELLCVQAPSDVPTIWARVDSDTADVTSRAFVAYATEAPLPDGFGAGPLTYVGTYHLQSGSDSFHVFERDPNAP